MFLLNLGIPHSTSCHIQKDHHKNIHRRENLTSRSIHSGPIQFHLQIRIDISVAFSVPTNFQPVMQSTLYYYENRHLNTRNGYRIFIRQLSKWKYTWLFKINWWWCNPILKYRTCTQHTVHLTLQNNTWNFSSTNTYIFFSITSKSSYRS